jgi:hypothetical protein
MREAAGGVVLSAFTTSYSSSNHLDATSDEKSSAGLLLWSVSAKAHEFSSSTEAIRIGDSIVLLTFDLPGTRICFII